MIKALNKREKIIFYAALGVVVSTLVFNLLFGPALAKNLQLNKEINIARLKLRRYARLLSHKGDIQNKYEKLVSFPGVSGEEKGSLVSALTELENLAKNANIRIMEIKPQGVDYQSSDVSGEILIDLRAEGTMEEYLKFFYNIENSLSLLKIEKLRLSAKPNAPILEGAFSISRFSVMD